ncbi:MAG: ATP synthase F1 subunit delta [Planctomycetota bacterium]|nr:ATP synthase F1 subunit delta [Planctomycetota bacterium]
MADVQHMIQQHPEAVDKIYAQSIFELAEARGGRPLLEEIADEMEQLDELRERDPQIQEFFRSRIITGVQKAAVLERALKGRINELVLNLVLVLARKERQDRIWRVFTAYDRMLQERFGRVEVDVYTRYPIPAEQLDGLRDRLARLLSREPVVHAYVDESMIGGVRLQMGDKLIDASIDASLRRMREQLIDRGGDAIRARSGRVIEE